MNSAALLRISRAAAVSLTSCFPKQVHVAVGMIAFITLLIDAEGENFLN